MQHYRGLFFARTCALFRVCRVSGPWSEQSRGLPVDPVRASPEDPGKRLHIRGETRASASPLVLSKPGRPVREVRVEPFLVARHPITVGAGAALAARERGQLATSASIEAPLTPDPT
ncbi:hypothetical protein GCM10010340_39790 [Streptomyces griseoloalbus]|nr:hypothetical protein GCM10010340_39790 [Streptomyces albaduncus]